MDNQSNLWLAHGSKMPTMLIVMRQAKQQQQLLHRMPYHWVVGNPWLKVCIAEASLVYGLSIMRQIPQHSLLSARVQIACSEDQQQMLTP